MRPLFFFSSRRRHTRFDCDWSSDVCSSDLRRRRRRRRRRLLGLEGGAQRVAVALEHEQQAGRVHAGLLGLEDAHDAAQVVGVAAGGGAGGGGGGGGARGGGRGGGWGRGVGSVGGA